MRGLTHLDLASNRVEDLTALAGLASLQWLDLSDNEIVDLGPLSALVGLRKLWLWRNRVADATPLDGLAALRWLDLGANELGSVEAILGLSQLATRSFQDNYIDLTAADLIESLATLSGRGTSVRAEPQRDLGFWATSEDGR
jgi:Leucine-rich repeat (LRR) protein